jgi:hypothetical protein
MMNSVTKCRGLGGGDDGKTSALRLLQEGVHPEEAGSPAEILLRGTPAASMGAVASRVEANHALLTLISTTSVRGQVSSARWSRC